MKMKLVTMVWLLAAITMSCWAKTGNENQKKMKTKNIMYFIKVV